MKTTFTSALVLVSVAAGLTTGCISHDETVYQDTERMPVSFESETAGRVFFEALSRKPGGRSDETSTEVDLPIVFHHKVKTVRGPNGAFNEAVLRCDTNRDGKITEQEANIFAAQGK
jgi:hypothetical protein